MSRWASIECDNCEERFEGANSDSVIFDVLEAGWVLPTDADGHDYDYCGECAEEARQKLSLRPGADLDGLAVREALGF